MLMKSNSDNIMNNSKHSQELVLRSLAHEECTSASLRFSSVLCLVKTCQPGDYGNIMLLTQFLMVKSRTNVAPAFPSGLGQISHASSVEYLRALVFSNGEVIGNRSSTTCKGIFKKDKCTTLCMCDNSH